jgi:hypothetical protein
MWSCLLSTAQDLSCNLMRPLINNLCEAYALTNCFIQPLLVSGQFGEGIQEAEDR